MAEGVTVDGVWYPSTRAWSEASDKAGEQRDRALLAGARTARSAQPQAGGGDRAGTVAFWMGQGAPQHVAEGIADRVSAESGYKPSIMGDAGTSGGLYQHHADRLARLKQFAEQQGKPWTDPLVQHQFSASEVKGGDAIAAKHWQEILSAPDQKTAAMLWDRYFERSAGGPGAGGGGTRMGGRFGGMGPRLGGVPGSDATTDPIAGLVLGGDAASRSRLSLALSPSPPGAVAAPGAAQPAQAAAPVAAAPHPLQPVPLQPVPNLHTGYQDALAAILSGKRRGLGSIFG